MSPWYALNAIAVMSIRDFADKHGLKLKVTERATSVFSEMRYYACFEDVEVMERGCLSSAFGNGRTPDAAIEEYARILSLTRIAVDATRITRREIDVPRLFASNGTPGDGEETR